MTTYPNLRLMAEHGRFYGFEQSQEELQAALAENDRMRKALERIRERSSLEVRSWRPDRPFPTNGAHEWHNGYVTCLSTHALYAFEALDPAGWAEHQDDLTVGRVGSDREWFDRTGNCGHCGNPGVDCLCTPDDPCGCGPHELRPEPRPCGWCGGTGTVQPHHAP